MKTDCRLQKEGVDELSADTGVTVKRHIHPGDIKARIQSALQRQARLDASAMSIAVDGTTVTLGGVVDSWSERMAARNAAWSEPGVQNVIDNLSVAD